MDFKLEAERNYEKQYLDSLDGKLPSQIDYFPLKPVPSKANRVPAKEKERVDNLKYNLSNRLRNVLDIFKYAVYYRNTSAVMVIDGVSGMGKTTLAGQCGLYCDPKFDLRNFHWTPTTFIQGEETPEEIIKKGLKGAKRGDFILFDEAMIISNRSSLSKLNRAIVQAMSMIRSKNLFICFCVNSIFDLDKNLAISRANLLLHVYGPNLYDRGQFMAFYKGNDKRNRLKLLYLLGKKYYDYSKPSSNFFTKFPGHFVVDDEIYDNIKNIGVDEFLNQDEKVGGGKYRRCFQRLLIYVRNNVELNQEKISKITGVSIPTITNLMREYKEERGMDTSKHIDKMKIDDADLFELDA